MAIFFISLRFRMPFPKIGLAMLFSDNGLEQWTDEEGEGFLESLEP